MTPETITKVKRGLMPKTITVSHQAFMAVDSGLPTLNYVIDFRGFYSYVFIPFRNVTL